jgi:hypothetical protein
MPHWFYISLRPSFGFRWGAKSPAVDTASVSARVLGFCLLVWLIWVSAGFAEAAEAGPTEAQVKAALLFNIAKYVEWPTNTFASASTPLVVGICEGGAFGIEFEKFTAGKMIGDRPVRIRRILHDQEYKECHILFIGAAEKKRQAEILDHVKGLPLLTAGETDDFLRQGGMIEFVIKENKVRFQVNLAAARKIPLSISSRVLNVADVVTGKAERSAE